MDGHGSHMTMEFMRSVGNGMLSPLSYLLIHLIYFNLKMKEYFNLITLSSRRIRGVY
jgi:hypothetical protein